MPDFQTPPNVHDTANIKQHLKYTFTRLLWTLFSAEPQWNFNIDPKEEGLHIFTRFPQNQRELPSIAVSLSGVTGTRKSLESELPESYADHLMMGDLLSPPNPPQDAGEHHREVQGFDVRGIARFDIAAVNDTIRDELTDRLVDFFIWRSENTAGLDSKAELEARWVAFDVDNFALAGDQEIPLEEATGDLLYTEGLAIPFIAEMYHFGRDQEPLEKVTTHVDAVGG